MFTQLPKFILATLVLLAFTSACTDQKTRICNKLGETFAEKERANEYTKYDLNETESFYSPKVDACIHTEQRVLGGVYFRIRDISKTVIQSKNSNLFYCDESGADSVILEKVREADGWMDNVPYKNWLDDGFGGPPRTLKAPEKPYTQVDCQKGFDKWLRELKS